MATWQSLSYLQKVRFFCSEKPRFGKSSGWMVETSRNQSRFWQNSGLLHSASASNRCVVASLGGWLGRTIPESSFEGEGFWDRTDCFFVFSIFKSPEEGCDVFVTSQISGTYLGFLRKAHEYEDSTIVCGCFGMFEFSSLPLTHQVLHKLLEMPGKQADGSSRLLSRCETRRIYPWLCWNGWSWSAILKYLSFWTSSKSTI